jgi:hypothetical protein
MDPDIDKVKQLMELARKGALPEYFNKWDIKDESGWTLAHESVLNGHDDCFLFYMTYFWSDCHGITVNEVREIWKMRRRNMKRRKGCGR